MVILSEIEMLGRARIFVDDFKDAKKENAETHTFYNEFFKIFGIKRRDVAQFEMSVKKLESVSGDPPGRIDLLWKKVLLVEQKSADKKLTDADNQALDYYLALPDTLRPRYIMSCNFHTIHLIDLDAEPSEREHTFKLTELPKKLSLFGFMYGKIKNDYEFEEKVSIEASLIMSRLYDELKKINYPEQDVAELLTRLAYCYFAEDTDIFAHNQFKNYILNHGNDCSNLGPKLDQLFIILNTPKDKRQESLDSELADFPYINGQLFAERIEMANFNTRMRDNVIDAANFNWAFISPAIFGSLFQSVMDEKERHDEGVHYTSEENILKVINPLFMNNLWDQFESISNDKHQQKKKLEEFQKKLSKLKFLDPACGSGSFLIIAYGEIRKLELEVISLLHKDKTLHDSTVLSKVDVHQFYGIEKAKFPVRITESALWMMDHLQNKELMIRYDGPHIRIPLKHHPHIKHADACELDWNEILSSDECSYIMGNPPFVGSRIMNPEQKAQIKKIANIKQFGALDYVSAWFIKASQYVNKKTSIGMVATQSIAQGNHVSPLWTILDREKMIINFAYQPFKWSNDTKGEAKVTVVIIGMSKTHSKNKQLFDSTGKEFNPKNISSYLKAVDMKLPIVKKSSNPLNGLPKISFGTQPIDGGYYIFTDEEKIKFLNDEPNAEKFFRPFIGAEELINGSPRWILILQNATPDELQKLPNIKKRIQMVKEFRLSSARQLTRQLAETPIEFNNTIIPTNPFLVIPGHSSEKREYIPIAYMKPPAITSNATFVIENADESLFGLVTSKMHMVWLRSVGGKLETRLRYSAGNVYNTFPVPGDYSHLKKYGENILKIRENYNSSTLSVLYNPITMPTDLKKSHMVLDKAVDKLYGNKLFHDDNERREFLMGMYKKMIEKRSIHN